MPLDRFMIAPLQGGLETDLRPWLIPDDAFARLNNAYIFRGRVRKRFGSRLMNDSVAASVAQLSSRVRIDIGTISGTTTLNIPGANLGTMNPWVPSYPIFSVGNDIFTVYQQGTNVALFSTNSGASATINTNVTPNTITITGETNGTHVYYYPSTPIMGFIMYETASSNADPTFVFDTQFAYQYTSGAFVRVGTAVWTGTDTQFFWGTTWGMDTSARNLFVVNNNAADVIKYWNGTTWYDFAPPVLINTSIPASIFLKTALITVVFKNRLIFLNTTENVNTTAATPSSTNSSGNGSGTVAGGTGAIGNFFYIGNQKFTVVASSGALAVSGGGPTGAAGTFNTGSGAYTFTGAAPSQPIYFFTSTGTDTTYTNRARWAAWGDPLANVSANGIISSSFRQDIPGFGNALDAATMEDIVSCQFIKDRLIVFFERSTWELVYTGNQAQPFTWQKLNTELGAESPFSSVPFDKYILTIGNVGIHACNGVNVERIDNKIPDTVWQADDGTTSVNRIYGIRDYYVEQVYWTFPNVATNSYSSTYPNKVLVYNYKTGSWAFNDDSITAFGYYYAASQSAVTWSSTEVTWDNNEVTWDSGIIQPLAQQIIAGNQQGYVFIVDANQSSNAEALQITNITLSNESSPGSTNGSGNLSGTVSGSMGAIGNYFIVGNQIFTVVVPNGAMVVSGSGPGGAAGTFNISTGVFSITGSTASTIVLFFGPGPSNVTLKVINHNLNNQDYIYIQFLNGLTGPFLSLYQVDSISDANTFTIIAPDIQTVLATGQLYTGGGTIARVSRIDILTKQLNFYVQDNRNATVQKVDFLVDRTANGEFTVDYLVSTSGQGLLASGQSNGTLVGTGMVETSPYALYPLESQQDRLWHPTYPFAEGECVQLRIYLSDDEMGTYSVAISPFQLHAMTFFCQPTSSRLQ